MSTAKREFAPGNYYHVFSRGNSKQKIFLYSRIPQKELFEYSFDRGEVLVEICSWVLMSNHFHLLIFVPENGNSENISKFISKLLSSYLHYFNRKQNRTGGLFEGRFESILVDNDLHLKYLYSYIHLNPLKMLDENWKENLKKIKNAQAYLNDYKFSSYHDLVNLAKRKENNILSQNQKVLEISLIVNTLDRLFSVFDAPRGATS